MAGAFDRPFEASPVGRVQPNGRPKPLELINMFRYDAAGRLAEKSVEYDKLGVPSQSGVHMVAPKG